MAAVEENAHDSNYQNYDSQIDTSGLRKTFYTQCVQLRKTAL